MARGKLRAGGVSQAMKVLHLANWVSGVTSRNVNALKQYSRHSHEFIARIEHVYNIGYEPPCYTEATTTREVVLALAEEADVLHFAAVGFDGTPELPETIHGIDWSEFLGRKRFVLSGMCSMLAPDGKTWFKPCGDKFTVRNLNKYDLLVGPHLSCKKTYAERLEYVPDIIPIDDWLYTPAPGPKPPVVCSFKGWESAEELKQAGIDFRILPTPTKMAEQLDLRRNRVKATLDNFNDGHWGLFGMESLSQGIPSATYIHPMNRECFEILGIPQPPFLEVGHGGTGLVETLRRVLEMPEDVYAPLRRECRDWIERYYNPKALVRRWDSVYETIA